ncbi:MAG TPA: hypothetical protein VN408_19325, partial [Actinoplanes sp.]|nr:hypothetical protein [Actinoplanes sp.]
MTGTHDGCPDIKVTPTPSGGLLLIGPEVTQVPHPVALITAMGAAKPVDAELVHLIEQRPLSADTQRFFAGQPYRENLVVAPWALVDGPAADTLTAGPEPAVRYADFLGLQIQVPPERIGRSGSARLLPVDEAGRVTGWDRATAVRVLPLAHVAARAAVALAIEVATGPEPPSWQRLAGFLARLEAAGGAAVPGPALAAAVRLARYGLPAGVDPAEPGRSAMPMSTAGLLDLLDGAPAAMPPGDLLDKIRAGGQGAALVLYRPFHSAPRQIAWIVADGGRLWWIEAGQGALAVPFDPETDARHRADLADPDTLVVPMGDPPVPGTDPLPPEAPPQALRDLVPETAEALQRAIVTVRARFLRGPAESDAPAVTAVAAALRAQRPAEWPVPPHLLDTAREAFLDLLMAYDFLVAQSADPGFVPVDRLFDGPDAYTWLTGIGFTPDDAHRIATDGDLALDPDRIGPLVAALGLADAGTRRLVEFSEALGRIPDDLPAIAAQIGLAGPGPLWAVARDLGVPPE